MADLSTEAYQSSGAAGVLTYGDWVNAVMASESGGSITINPTTSATGDRTVLHTSGGTSHTQGSAYQPPTPAATPTITTARAAEIKDAAWNNQALSNPTPAEQALWLQDRQAALAEIARKAALGIPVDSAGNQSTWLSDITSQQDGGPGLLGGVGTALSNVSGAHPLATLGVIGIGLLALLGGRR